MSGIKNTNESNAIKLTVYTVENENKVYFETYDGFKLTSIKLYFENDINHNPLIQYQENTIINGIDGKLWTVVPNANERSLFFYVTTNQAISS